MTEKRDQLSDKYCSCLRIILNKVMDCPWGQRCHQALSIVTHLYYISRRLQALAPLPPPPTEIVRVSPDFQSIVRLSFSTINARVVVS